MKYILLSLLISSSYTVLSQMALPLVPYPQEIRLGKDEFTLDAKVALSIDSALQFEADYLVNEINFRSGIQIGTFSEKEKTRISLQLITADTLLPEGTYWLTITKDHILLQSTSSQGIFYGIQTLLQLIPTNQAGSVQLPQVEIYDYPKFGWRGMHLDVCRHFFDVGSVKRYIDYLSLYKMNVFHWHLTEDQGWRIEIKKYPLLTEIGAWRKGSMIGHYNDQRFDTLRYGGYYTQDEIREVVRYAAYRHITVVPEIELPGHALAALAAYPHLSCTGGPFEVGIQWGVFDDVYCTKEETFSFLEDVLSEVLELFPSKFIHIGGDECPKTRWKTCNTCQQTIAREGLKDEHELQSYFITRIEHFLNAKGRQIIGWDEILEGGLAPNAAVMSWRGTEGGIAAAKQHHHVVMSPGSHCYFDHYQDKPENEPVAIGGFTTTEKVYGYEPVPSQLNPEEARYILGAQGNVWTEYMTTFDHVEYMIFPRMLALSEVLWGTARPADFDQFLERIQAHYTYFDKAGIRYKRLVYEKK
jgi:hexosaminidase